MLRLVSTGFALSVAAALAPVAAWPHHSIAGYSTETIELEGELVGIEWQNPHIRFALETRLPNGTPQRWRLEASSIFLRQRDGVTQELFRVGDKVKVAGRSSRRDADSLLATNMLLPDGREAPLWPQATPRFVSDEKFIRAAPQTVDAEAENRGLFRVWVPPIPSPRDLPFKSEAVTARGRFDVADCDPQGMPRIMHTNAFPRELINLGSAIVLRTELFDTVRTIHMDGTEPPADEPKSRLGYSVGRWDGEALVVRTTLVDWPYFDEIGTPQSDEVTITERFALSPDQSRVDYEMTVVDATTFTSPAVIDIQWQAFAGEVQRYNCRPGR